MPSGHGISVPFGSPIVWRARRKTRAEAQVIFRRRSPVRPEFYHYHSIAAGRRSCNSLPPLIFARKSPDQRKGWVTSRNGSHRSNCPGDPALSSGAEAMRLGSHLEALDRRIAAEAFDAAQDSRGCIGASCVALNFFSQSRIGDLGATVPGNLNSGQRTERRRPGRGRDLTEVYPGPITHTPTI